jgi:Reverse transcriptase (RNA-dependent DNA polymerase)
LDFSFYDLVWYWHQPGDEDNPRLGRWLGVAHRVGSDLCYWILNQQGNVLARTSVQHVTELEQRSPDLQAKIRDFRQALKIRLNPDNFTEIEPGYEGFHIQDEEIWSDDQAEPLAVGDEYTPYTYDEYIGSELYLPSAGEMVAARVTKRLCGPDGSPIGVRNDNPVLDTRMYETILQDGSAREYSANLIAEYLQAQMEPSEVSHDVFRAVVDHHADETATKAKNVLGYDWPDYEPLITTTGWFICVEWDDDSVSWLPLKQVKESNPVLLAEYARRLKLLKEPAFQWWAPKVLEDRDRILSKMKSKRYWRTSFKYGVKLPKSVEEAFQIDRETGTSQWRQAIEKEMLNVRAAFAVFIGGTMRDVMERRALVGYTKINCHMIFDVKMESLTRKARFVAGGHMTQVPESETYSSVVSRESVRITLFLTSLDELEVSAADVGNAYINAKCREKVYTIAGKEFGNDEGKIMLITRALYGLKSSGRAWREMFAGTMSDIGFKNSEGDRDVWLRANDHPGTKEQYYEKLLVYVDDILCASHDPGAVMDVIAKLYRLKEGSVGEPKRYLGANIGKMQTEDGRTVWYMSAESYIQAAVANIEEQLKNEGYGNLRTRVPNPIRVGYRPEVDVTQALPEWAIRYYQGLIGVARWCIEIGRIDITTEISKLSSHSAAPREGHLDALLDVFAYLKRHPKARIVFDDAVPPIDDTEFVECDWKEFYPGAGELLPAAPPEPLGRSCVMTCFVDADHAGNLATRRSQTGILILLNSAPIVWYSKRQNTVEASTFGSEFNALRVAVDLIVALRFKLRMLGVEIDRATNVFCDNQSVVLNSSLPHSTLTKKHNSICFHWVREAVAAGIIRVAYVKSEKNLADGLTKTLDGERRRSIYSRIMDGLYNE